MTTLWESIPRKIVGYTCPYCHKSWNEKEAPNYCPVCGEFVKQFPKIEYNIPEVMK